MRQGRWPWLLIALLAVGASAAPVLPAPVQLRSGDATLALPVGAGEAERALRKAAAGLAARPVLLVSGRHRWTTTLGELGVGLTPQAEALAHTPRQRVPLWRRWLPAQVRPGLLTVDAERLALALAALQPRPELPAMPAQLVTDGESVRVDPGRGGWAVDREVLAARLLTVAGGAPPEVELPLQPVAAHPSAEAVAALGVRRRLALFSSEFDPRIPRAENVARATAALDGLYLAPGAVLSFLELVGPVEAERGFKPAYVIEDGRLVEGVGGGVCQVASTLYGVALRAGLEVVERHPHALAVSYLPLSQDAAVAPGVQDLKLRNSTGHHVLLRAWAAGGRVSIAIYGDAPPGRHVEVQSQELASYPPPVIFTPEPSLPAGKREVREEGAAGHRSVAWRLIYDGDTLVRREQLSLDSYPAAPRRVALGTG